MANHHDIAARLRALKPDGQVALFREAIAQPNVDKASLTDILLTAVSSGALGPPVFSLWLSFANDPQSTVKVLRQDTSETARRHAIKHFARLLRGAGTFRETWAAVGQESGLAVIVANLSVSNITGLCRALGRKLPCSDGRPVFRDAMTKLLVALCSDSNTVDERRLEAVFGYIAPACNVDTALQWDSKSQDLTIRQQRFRTLLYRSHPAALQKMVIEKALKVDASNEESVLDLSLLKPVIDKDLDFGIDVLGQIAKSDTLLGLSSDTLMNQLMLSLAKRCNRRRGPSQNSSLRFWRLINTIIPKHVSLRRLIDVEIYHRIANEGLLFHVTQSWRYSLCAPHDDEILSTFISCLSEEVTKSLILEKLVKTVPWGLRYRLLRIFYQNSRSHGFDIGPSTSTDKCTLGKHKLRPRTSIFLALPAHEGFNLLERCIIANPELSILSTTDSFGSSIVDRHFSPDADFADPHLLRALLLREADHERLAPGFDVSALLENLYDEVDERKKKSAHGRTQDTRTFWASSALFLATAIGDLDVLDGTLVWARRFSNESQTAYNFYHNTLRMSELAQLLSVVSLRVSRPADVKEVVKAKVEQANKIILTLMTTAVLARNEPEFDTLNWHRPMFDLITTVVKKRLKSVNGFQDRFRLSDTDIFDIVWESTIATLTEVESIFLRPENEKFQRQRVTIWPYFGHVGNLRPASMRFIDDLARSRNDTWEKHRCSVNPDVMTLPEPWPRGVPIQQIVSVDVPLVVETTPIVLPYIQSRAKSIVFGDPEIYLGEVGLSCGDKKAIGKLIDSWTTALELYVGGQTKQEREVRVKQAWAYATENLTYARLSEDERIRLWGGHFRSAKIDTSKELSIEKDARFDVNVLQLPMDNTSEPVEWHPSSMLGAYSKKVKERSLSKSCLDVLLNVSRGFKASRSVPGLPKGSIWDFIDKLPHDAPEQQIDTLVAAAVLYWNGVIGSDSSIMMTKLPDADTTRFPAMFLDGEFLEKESHSDYMPLGVLSDFRNHVPVELFSRLVASIYKKLNDDKDATHQQARVVKLMNEFERCDHPSAAISVIEKFVVDMPRNSSWHRKVLNTGFLRSLPPRETESLLTRLADVLLELHKQQPITLPPAKKDPAENMEVEETKAEEPPESAVKITTLKLLAQILRDGQVVSPRFAISLLVRILGDTGHIDIHLAAFTSLLNLARTSKDPDLTSSVLQILRKFAIQRASSMDERRPAGRRQWEAAEAGGDMPEVWDYKNGCPPVIDLLRSAAVGFKEESEETRAGFTQLLYEALQASAATNQRWLNLFMKKHGFTLPGGESLPTVPVFPVISAELLLRHSPPLPAQQFGNLRRFVLLNIKPGPGVVAINKQIREDSKLVNSNAGKHWLSLWANQGPEGLNLGGGQAGKLLRRLTTDKYFGPSVAPQVEALESFVLDMVDTVLLDGKIKIFNAVMHSLKLDVEFGASYKRACGENGTLLERIISRINDLRTEQWQLDPNRQPEALPQTFHLRLKLIQAPVDEDVDMDGNSTSTVSSVTEQILLLLEEMTKGDLPYHYRFGTIKSDLSRRLSDSFPLVVSLGSPPAVSTGSPTAVDYLRVELAREMLQKYEDTHSGIKDWKVEDADAAKALLQAWSKSTVEEFREHGRRLIAAFGLRESEDEDGAESDSDSDVSSVMDEVQEEYITITERQRRRRYTGR